MSLEKATELLQQTIFGDKKCISYRLLSRKLGVHVNEAKKLLQEFYDNNSESLDASFVIIGVEDVSESRSTEGEHEDEDVDMTANDEGSNEKSNEDPNERIVNKAVHSPLKERRKIAIFSKAELADAKNTFKTIIQESIYSVSISRACDVTLLSGDAYEVHRLDSSEILKTAFEVYGVIRNPSLDPELDDQKRSNKVRVAANPAKKVTESKSIEAKPSVQATNISTTVSKMASKPLKTATNAFDRFKVKQDDSGSKTTAAAPRKNPKPADMNPLMSAFAKAGQPKEPKEKVIITDISDPVGDATGEPEVEEVVDQEALKREREEKQKKLEKLQSIFSDDEDVVNESHKPSRKATFENDESMDDIQEEINDKPKEEAKAETKDETEEAGSPDWDYDAIMEDEDGGSTELKENKDEPGVKSEAKPEPKLQSKLESQSKRIHGRRKVSKRVTSVDENGYLVTEFKDEWESYSEGEDENDKADNRSNKASANSNSSKVPQIPSRKEKAKGAVKGQASLMSFFGAK